MFGKRKLPGELTVPAPALSGSDSHEVLRFWIANGTGHVSLRTGTNVKDTGDEPAIFWGLMMADIAQHAVEAMHLESDGERSRDQLMTRVTKVFLDELGFNRGVTGGFLDKDQ